MHPLIEWPWTTCRPHPEAKIPVDPTIKIILEHPGNFKALITNFFEGMIDTMSGASVEDKWERIQDLEERYGYVEEDEIDGQRD